MNDFFLHLGEYLIGASIVGLIVWVWALWLSHMKHKVEVANKFAIYLQRSDMIEVNSALSRMDASLQELVKIVYEIKGRSSQGSHHDG